MNPPHQPWPMTAAFQDALFVGQLINQLASEESFESFRSPCLDSITLINEAVELCDQVIEGRVPPETLRPIVEELDETLKRDEALRRLALARVEIATSVIKGFQKVDPGRLKAVLRYLSAAVTANYQAISEIVILELVTKGERTRLREAVLSYISFLINAGLSREFIRNANQRNLLCDAPVSVPIVAVVAFFSEMNAHRTKHIVFAALGSDFGRYLVGSDIAVVPLQQIASYARQKLATGLPGTGKISFGRIIVEAPDAYSAASKAMQRLAAARSLSMLAPKVVNCIWGELFFVESEKGGTGVFVDEQVSQLRTEPFQTLSKTTIKALAKRSRLALDRFDPASRERLLSATNTIALAANSLDPETQIVSLWSAFEILLSQPIAGVRILHYESLLLPLVCMRHIRRKFIAVHDALVNAFKGKYKKIVFELPSAEFRDDHTKFMNLILLPEYEKERRSVLSAVASSPLALNRLGELHHSFSKPSSMLQSFEAHEDRVRWQIHRLYRTRNNLVHAGRLPQFSRGIASDGYNFFRYAAGNIVRYAEPDGSSIEVDQCIAEVGFKYEALRKILRESIGQQAFTRDLISSINA